jgi:transketolase
MYCEPDMSLTQATLERSAQNLRSAFDAAAARKRCLAYRRRILEVSQQVTALHVAPAFSCTEIVDVIFHGLMRWTAPDQSPDVFLMSKGHGCLTQYVILEDMGVLSRKDLDLYCKPGGRLGAHPDFGVPGIAASTGSLGHGMGIAVGMAHAERLQERDGIVYLLLSDGECQEGSTWEGAMMAANLKLENLIAFVDLNDFGGLERMSDGHPAFHPLAEKFAAFGWDTAQVNGHAAGEIFAAADNTGGGRPLAVICRTVKGKGVSYMEHVPIWHYRSPNPEEYLQALAELVEISK